MLERIDITVGRADLARAAREGPERVLRCVLLGQDLARPDAAADVCVADGAVAGDPAPRESDPSFQPAECACGEAASVEPYAAATLRASAPRAARTARIEPTAR